MSQSSAIHDPATVYAAIPDALLQELDRLCPAVVINPLEDRTGTDFTTDKIMFRAGQRFVIDQMRALRARAVREMRT